jgi:intracellular multiplication protein IcmC
MLTDKLFTRYGLTFRNTACFVLLMTLASVCVAADATTGTGAGTGTSTGVSSLSAQEMLVNIAKQVPSLMRLVTAIAYVLGMYFIIHGIIKLKHAGESRTMMSREHSLMGPIVMLSVGAMLLYLPSSVQVGMSTFWTDPNPYAYLKQKDQWSDFINVCFTIVQLVGTIAFIRGLVLISHLGTGSGQHGTMSKGMTHIIGGILCINIYEFIKVITATLGIDFS